MEMMRMKYRCKKCGAVAEIDLENKKIIIEPETMVPPPLTAGVARQISFGFPSHPDCEFAKPINEINLKNLEPVEVHEFAFERSVPPP